MKKNKLLIFLLSFISLFGFMNSASANDSGFKDLDTDSPNYTAIQYLTHEGILEGYPDQTFGGEKEINRAELVAIVLRGLKINPDPAVYKNCFPDVEQEWFAPYICYAKEKNWIKGFEDGNFKPGNLTTEAEALKIIINPFFQEEIPYPDNSAIKSIIANYDKKVNASDWYINYLSFASDRGILETNKLIDYGAENPKRAKIAEYIFRVLLVKQENWVKYDSALSDLFLHKKGFADLISKNCHQIVPSDHSTFFGKNDFDFFKAYPDNKLNVQRISEISSPVHFCFLKEGGYLFSTFITKDGKGDIEGERQLISYDKNGEIVKYQSLSCKYKMEQKLISLPYPLSPVYYTDDFRPDLLPSNTLDPESLELLDCYYSKDKGEIYSDTDILDVTDINDFQVLQDGYAKDLKQVYYVDYITHTLENADPKSFELLEYPYSKDDEHVYYHSSLLPDTDADDFEILGYDYSKDSNRIYYKNNLLNADTNSFEVLDYTYSKDVNHVYRLGTLMDQYDAASFEILDSIGMMKIRDKNNTYDYWSGEVLKHPEGEILKAPIFSGDWIRTQDAIYLMDVNLIEVTDPVTFEFIDGVYSKDSKNVFHLRISYKKEDSLSALLSWEFLDIPGADPATFERLGENNGSYNLAKDKNHLYLERAIIETGALDLTTAKLISEKVVKDSKNYTCHINIESPGLSYCGYEQI